MGRRAESFGTRLGQRYPRVGVGVACTALAGFLAACANELSDGTYLGAYWLICAVTGMAAAAGMSVAVLVSRRRRSRAAGRLTVAWVVLTVVTMPAITAFPFPHNSLFPAPSPNVLAVQRFFNVVHAVMLGYTAMSCTALLALLVYLIARRSALAQPAGGAGGAGRS